MGVISVIEGQKLVQKPYSSFGVTGNRKREIFTLKREARKLTDAQRFSKLYYLRRYKGQVTEKWRDAYLTHYQQVPNQLASDSEVDETTLDKQVRESIRNALREGQLDLTIAASPGAEDDEEDDVDFDAENDENEGGDSGAKNSDAPPGESRSCETDDS